MVRFLLDYVLYNIDNTAQSKSTEIATNSKPNRIENMTDNKMENTQDNIIQPNKPKLLLQKENSAVKIRKMDPIIKTNEQLDQNKQQMKNNSSQK